MVSSTRVVVGFHFVVGLSDDTVLYLSLQYV